MDNVSNEIEHTRNEFRQQILAKIADMEDFSKFQSHVRVIFMHLGLTQRKEVIEWLESRDWSDPKQRNDYMDEIEEFLNRTIK